MRVLIFQDHARRNLKKKIKNRKSRTNWNLFSTVEISRAYVSKLRDRYFNVRFTFSVAGKLLQEFT